MDGFVLNVDGLYRYDREMICPQCREENKKSFVYSNGSTRTLLCANEFYDEEGIWHIHDSNITTSHYSCSNGHTFDKKTQGKCPCGWPNKV